MIPVGTLCYVVRLHGYPEDEGAVVTVMRHGPSPRTHRCGAVLRGDTCGCKQGKTVCWAKNSSYGYCIRDWAQLRPITPPANDVNTSTPREVETA